MKVTCIGVGRKKEMPVYPYLLENNNRYIRVVCNSGLIVI